MPASRSVLEILVDVKNAATGAQQIREVGKAGTEAGTGAEKTGKGFGSMAKQLAVAAGGAIAVKKGYDFLKGSANAAVGLARETAALTRVTGMDAQTSSAWVSIAKNRGIETNTLTRSFTIFSKQLRSVEQGGKAATTAFKDLGISADQLKGMKTEDALMATSDAFQKMPAGADKAAIAQQLFGRQAQALLPLLNMGSQGLQEQMEVMRKHGLTMDEAGVKKGLELAKAQREMKATTEGLKLSIGTALLPVLTSMAGAVMPVVQAITSFVQGSGFLQSVLPPVGIALAAAAATTWLWNSALLANPVGLVVVAIVGLVAALVAAYNNVGWFRDGVNAAFGAVKGAVGAVVGAFAGIGRAVASAASTAVGALGRVVSFVAGMPGKLGGAFSGMWNGLTSGVQAAVSAVTNTLNQIVSTATNIASKVKSALSDIGSAASSALSSATGGLINLQTGGTVPAGGRLALVGEAGPELMQLPGGTRITPLQQGTPAPVDLGPWGGGGEIHIHLDVDGRELAHVVASHAAEQQARR